MGDTRDSSSKQMIRKHALSVIDAISKKDRQIFSETIVNHINDFIIQNNYLNIGLYLAKDDEVNIDPLIKKVLEHKEIKVSVPAIEDNRIVYKYILSFDEVKVGKFGIREPFASNKMSQQTDAIFIPGLAFDKSGYRIGRGKGGYFDRYLVNFEGDIVGVCFSNQLFNKFQHEIHDIPVDYIVTEKGFMYCG